MPMSLPRTGWVAKVFADERHGLGDRVCRHAEARSVAQAGVSQYLVGMSLAHGLRSEKTITHQEHNKGIVTQLSQTRSLVRCNSEVAQTNHRKRQNIMK